MPEYINRNSYTVPLTGPDGQVIYIKSNQKKTLDAYFDKYCARGFIERISGNPNAINKRNLINESKRKIVRQQNHKNRQKVKRLPQQTETQELKTKETNKTIAKRISKAKKISISRNGSTSAKRPVVGKRLVVGRKLNKDPNRILRDNLSENSFPISNNIGVGILSYNRKKSLKRLVDSILRNTNLLKTTVFISDDGSDDKETIKYLNELQNNKNLVILRNDNIGIAGNSNRLLQCLSRFKYGLLLNDDVEILKDGWEYFYSIATEKTGIKHFQHRQNGVYGATIGQIVNKGQIDLRKVNDKPHGAILAFTSDIIEKCGYFNEEYGKYGMEHVDWSMKPHEFGLQEGGFFDVEGSSEYFKVHPEQSSVVDRTLKLRKSRLVHESRKVKDYKSFTNKSKVEGVTYVIPFRNIDREASIITVVNGVRAQRYPNIEIILAEQSNSSNINVDKLQPSKSLLVQGGELFNKSLAFNRGVCEASYDNIIMHDADMLLLGDYTSEICDVLREFDGCHLGKSVIYATKNSTDLINSSGIVDVESNCDRIVGYFEGGSLACRKSTYWKIGGFNEDYKGYGCEDCDFYLRLSKGCNWKEMRSFDLLHLWHGRVDGWNAHHNQNKQLERSLSSYDVEKRIYMQRNQLIRNGYEDFIAK